ncbi:MAG: AraC family transcriptional regulator [Myxococcota bacterium]
MATMLRDLQGLSRRAPTEQRVIVSRIIDCSASAVCASFGIKAVIEGQETYRVGDQLRVVRAGQFIVLPPGQSFEVGISREQIAVGLCIDMPADAVETFTGNISDHPDAVFSLNQDRLGEALVDLWSRANRAQRLPNITPHFAGWLVEHAHAMARLEVRRPSTRRDLYARVERARQYLHAHQDRLVSLDELARAANLSPHHLNRTFRQLLGTPPARYHRNLRLREAAVDLERGTKTATDLALELGYSDLPSFSRAFRRVHGVPPSALRRS